MPQKNKKKKKEERNIVNFNVPAAMIHYFTDNKFCFVNEIALAFFMPFRHTNTMGSSLVEEVKNNFPQHS